MQNGFDCPCGNGLPLRLIVMVDDLEEVMFCVLEHNEDAFVFEDDL